MPSSSDLLLSFLTQFLPKLNGWCDRCHEETFWRNWLMPEFSIYVTFSHSSKKVVNQIIPQLRNWNVVIPSVCNPSKVNFLYPFLNSTLLCKFFSLTRRKWLPINSHFLMTSLIKNKLNSRQQLAASLFHHFWWNHYEKGKRLKKLSKNP